jgi:predicted metalloprotease with PDZ domain
MTVHYRVAVHDVHAHVFRVTLRLARAQRGQRVSLPVWIPGSYMVREFSRHLSMLEAWQDTRRVPLVQLDKATWELRPRQAGAIEVRYLVYAFDTSVRAAFLDERRGFFNGTALLLRVEGHEDQPHQLDIRDLPRGWQVATALRAVRTDASGAGSYEAADYHELIDHPVELGTFWRGRFEAHGVPHEFVVAGALPSFDGERLLADTRAICEAQIDFWHPKRAARGRTRAPASRPPFDRYVFMLNAVDDGYGGLEHRASTALVASRRDLPRRLPHGARSAGSDAYVTLLGLISHEYFHTWNVKRLKPAELATIDYTRENYTALLWFFEGFTSYYDDLMLRRAGRIDDQGYLRLVGKTIGGVLATPGRGVQSVAQASFDAWVKYYRSDENTPNATVSYYTKGALVALALDLTLRTEGHGSLDAVMRELWTRSGGGPISEADIAAALEHVGRRSFAGELAAWVHGTGDLPLRGLLERAGLTWKTEPGTLAQRLGLRVTEGALTGVQVKGVLRGSLAEKAGLAAGDELLAADGWRLRRLDDLQTWLTPGAAVPLLVARDQRIVTLRLTTTPLPTDAGGITLGVSESASTAQQRLRRAWLAP